MKQGAGRGDREKGQRYNIKQRVEGKGRWKSSSTRYDLLGSPGLPHACARIIKHYMKYSLLLHSDTGFIFVEGKSPRRAASVKVSTQQNTVRLAGKGLGARQRNATETVLRGVTGEIKRCGRDKQRGQEGVCIVMGEGYGVEVS